MPAMVTASTIVPTARIGVRSGPGVPTGSPTWRIPAIPVQLPSARLLAWPSTLQWNQKVPFWVGVNDGLVHGLGPTKRPEEMAKSGSSNVCSNESLLYTTNVTLSPISTRKKEGLKLVCLISTTNLNSLAWVVGATRSTTAAVERITANAAKNAEPLIDHTQVFG